MDGAVYVGSIDGNVYAIDAGVDAEGPGSRLRLGTLGHTDDWVHADSAGGSAGGDALPGFGVVGAVTGLAGAAWAGRRRLDR